MHTSKFKDRTEYHFWGNVDYPSNQEAKERRDLWARELRLGGYLVKKSSLPGQMRKYSGIGRPDGRVGTVYVVEANKV